MLSNASYRSRRCIALLALLPMVLPLADAIAAEAPDPFHGLQALDARDLARYRGGFITVAGWEIAFSVTIDVNIDNNFQVTTWFNPMANPAAGPASGVMIQGTGTPVHVSVTNTGIRQRVGTIDGTLIETIANLDRVSQIVSNTRNNASIRALTTVTIDLLNHSQRINGTGAGNRLQGLGMRHVLSNLGRSLSVLGR